MLTWQHRVDAQALGGIFEGKVLSQLVLGRLGHAICQKPVVGVIAIADDTFTTVPCASAQEVCCQACRSGI
jgi:hypothetical protein